MQYRGKRINELMVWLAAVMMFAGGVQPLFAGGEVTELPSELAPVRGSMTQINATVARKAYSAQRLAARWDYGGGGFKGEAEFHLTKDFDFFECSVALDDRATTGSYAIFAVIVTAGEVPGSGGVDVDGGALGFLATFSPPKGKILAQVKKRLGEEPSTIRVPVRGALRLALWVQIVTNANGEGTDLAPWIQPRFIVGNASSSSIRSASNSSTSQSTSSTSTSESYSISIDPRDMTELVASLKSQVQSDAALSNAVPIQLAVARFRLVAEPSKGTLSPTVADNVLEDLSTELIKSRTFKLVERSQLDQQIKEMKIGDTGVIDSATAQRLGHVVGAKAILIGSISDRGKFAVINCRLINTETGEATIAGKVESRE